MATKTKADFIAEGERAARMGNTNGAMPEFGEGKSWQAQAFAAGFNGYKDENPDTVESPKVEAVVVAEAIAPVLTKNAKHHTLAVAPVVASSIPRAVSEHIRILGEKCLDIPPRDPRLKRFLNKIDKLEAKWGKRFATAG